MIKSWVKFGIFSAGVLTFGIKLHAEAAILQPPSVTVIAIGVDQSFDKSTIGLRYAEATARRLSEAAGGIRSLTQTVLLTSPTMEQAEAALMSKQNRATRDLLILYIAGPSDEEGIHMADQKISHQRLAQLIAEFPARRKAVIMDRMMIGNGQPGKQSFRTATYPNRGTSDEPIAYLIADADQLSAYESHSIRSVNMSDIVILGIRGRADRDQNGKITWSEIISYTEKTLKYSLRPRSGGRMFLDHSEGTSQIPLNLDLRENAQERTAISMDTTAQKSEKNLFNISAPKWLLELDPGLGLAQHKGFRDSESKGNNIALDVTAYKIDFFGGDWSTGLEVQHHALRLVTDNATGAADYTGVSARVRARYQFSWGFQDLRPQVGLGQVWTHQKLNSTRELSVLKSSAFSPLMHYGIASHFFSTGSQFHGGIFFRNETLYGTYEGASQKFKTSYMGLEIAFGGSGE